MAQTAESRLVSSGWELSEGMTVAVSRGRWWAWLQKARKGDLYGAGTVLYLDSGGGYIKFPRKQYTHGHTHTHV